MDNKHSQRRPVRSIDGFFSSHSQLPRHAYYARRSDQPAPRVVPTMAPQGLGQPEIPVAQPIPEPPVVAPASQELPISPYQYHQGSYGQSLRKVPKKHRLSPRNWSWKKVARNIALAVVLLVVFSGGWVGWKFYRNVAKVTHDSDPLSLLSVFHPTPIKSQNDWVNILVAGDSADRVDPGANGGNLTDSIMILSVNTQTKTGFMLSIPRDLWVDVPEEGWAKINSTYEFDGMSGLDQLVDTDFGIPIDYYALVNYQAFEDLVNAVGGIAVDIQSPDPRGLYDPQPYPGASAFKLANGWQTLDGLQALDLARARGDAYGSYGFPGSDFARTQHQRQMVLAIKDKITSSSVISNPLKLGQIADAIGNNVVTNLQLSQAEALYSLTKNINDSSVQSLNINTLVSGQNLLTRYAASNGESSLIPAAGVGNYSAIREAITKLMSNNPVVKESANIVVLNGGNIVGLAAAEGNILAAKGMDVSEVADAPQLYPTTTIINNSNGSDPNTKQALTALYGNNYSTNANLSADYPSADFIVILGENVTMPSGSTTSISQ